MNAAARDLFVIVTVVRGPCAGSGERVDGGTRIEKARLRLLLLFRCLFQRGGGCALRGFVDDERAVIIVSALRAGALDVARAVVVVRVRHERVRSMGKKGSH